MVNIMNAFSHSFAQTYNLKQGIKKFGQKGYDSALKEMKQLHDRDCFEPVEVSDLTMDERRKAMESLIFLTQKRDSTIKARSSVIDAKEGRDVAIIDIPNAFIQTALPKQEKGKRVILKIRGPMVDMLVKIDPERYRDKVVYEGKKRVLYVIVLKAIYGMLVSALLFYKKLMKDLEEIGFEKNPYDPCVANRMINGEQHTVTWHVDDLKSSVKSAQTNDNSAWN